MSKSTINLIIIGAVILVIILSIVGVIIGKRRRYKKYDMQISNLEREKNLIISASILSELNKVETLINNEKLKTIYKSWQKRFKELKDKELPRINDRIMELVELLDTKNYKTLKVELAQVELDVFYVKVKSNYLLEEIRELTLSEEKNREIVTKLKSKYREIIKKYNTNKDDYKSVGTSIELQFENVDKLFSAFEVAMQNNAYTEIGKIVKGIDDTVGNLDIIIEETPSIIVMGESIIPKKMQDLSSIYKKLTKEGYNLDYLNLEYNINEANKKIQDIFARLKVLNVEDSIFSLKTMVDYFDTIYNDFDKERISRKMFDELSRTIAVKITKFLKITKSLYSKIDDIKYSYDLTDDELKIVDDIRTELVEERKDYDLIMSAHRSHSFAYSKLAKEMEHINVSVTKTEDKLEIALRSFGSLKDDELRAREQLDEIKEILKQAKIAIKSYKLPTTPKRYYIELSEASNSIKEIVAELDKKPISIKILNTRVDTARDLVLKVYNTSNELIKSAWMAEKAIIYGNRYRFNSKEIELGLNKAEGLFFKGNFKASLENAINAINIVEPGVYKRLLDSYKK